MVERNMGSRGIVVLILLCTAIFLYFSFLNFTNSFQTQYVFEQLAKKITASNYANYAELFRSYFQYVVANLLLFSAVLIAIPLTRVTGSLLGLVIMASILAAYFLVPLDTALPINNEQGTDSGLNFGLTILASAACLMLFMHKLIKPATKREKPKAQTQSDSTDKAAKLQELYDEPPEELIDGDISFNTEATHIADESFNQLLFAVKRQIRDEILGDDLKAYQASETIIKELEDHQQYFPRRPMIMPKLIRAINNDDSGLKELVDVISLDPMLAGELLKIANSPFFRMSDEPVESIGRAIVVLGMDGLKSLASSLVMQPVVKVETSYFPNFSTGIWNHSALAAVAAQIYARHTKSCDSFSAHLLALLSGIGHIVIFQVMVRAYEQVSGVRPKIEVLRKLRANYADGVSAEVVKTWGLSDDFIQIFHDYQTRAPLAEMKPLGLALYYGRLSAMLNTLYRDNRYSEEDCKTILLDQGLSEETYEAMWSTLEKAQDNPGII